jgi:hypothetical protein
MSFELLEELAGEFFKNAVRSPRSAVVLNVLRWYTRCFPLSRPTCVPITHAETHTRTSRPCVQGSPTRPGLARREMPVSKESHDGVRDTERQPRTYADVDAVVGGYLRDLALAPASVARW